MPTFNPNFIPEIDNEQRELALLQIRETEFPGWGKENEMELTIPQKKESIEIIDSTHPGIANNSNDIQQHLLFEDATEEVHTHSPSKLSSFLATSICGNDILASVLYCTGLVTERAGKLAPLCIVLVCLMLYLMRSIYEEGIMTLPLNGGCYGILLNSTSKRVACISACLSVLTYTATGVVSAASATSYLGQIWGELDSIQYMILLLLIFACLTGLGLSESAQVAAGIFIFHIFTLSVLVLLCIAYSCAHTQTFNDNLNTPYPDVKFVNSVAEGTLFIALFAGFSTAMLGITGFETSAQFVEEQAPGVFPLTLRNMWFSVMIYNPLISFFALFVMSVNDIIDNKNVVLVKMMETVGDWICNDLGSGISLGDVLGKLMAVDAFIVLCGSILTSYVGINGLIKRLTNDRCLPEFLLTKNSWRGTHHYILIGYFLISSSLVLIVNGNDDSVAGVYTFAFLALMCFFCFGLVLLKYKRAQLPRQFVCPWWKIFVGFTMLVIGFIGNLLVRTEILPYFILYYMCSGFIFVLMFERTDLLKLISNVGRSLFPNYEGLKYIKTVLEDAKDCSFIFYTKTPTLSLINKAVLYVRSNEATDHIIITHCYNPETLSEAEIERLKLNFRNAVQTIDCIYPKVQIDLLFVKGTFTPTNVSYISEKTNIPKNRMFIACPSHNFQHTIDSFGGVRIVTH